MNYSCSWCIAAPSTKALAGRGFLFCSRRHTKILPCDRLLLIYFTRKFLYGSYLKQIWQHSNEQFSPQTHPSYASFSSTEIFQHCQAFVIHGPNLCHLFFILARQRCAEVKGLPHNSIPPGKAGSTCTFQGISMGRETEPGCSQLLLPMQKSALSHLDVHSQHFS